MGLAERPVPRRYHPLRIRLNASKTESRLVTATIITGLLSGVQVSLACRPFDASWQFRLSRVDDGR